jgi:hypothetical protein
MTTPTVSEGYSVSVGTTSNRISVPIYEERDPTVNDINYFLGQPWLNKLTGSYWVLVQFTIVSKVQQAVWNNFNASSTGSISFVAGTGINITGSPAGFGGTVTISNTAAGSGFTWNDNATSRTMVSGNGYLVKAGAQQTFVLPTSSAVGDLVEVCWVSGAGGWKITQAAGQQVRFAATTTTVGTGGSLTSTSVGNTIRLVCTTANTTWLADYNIGTITLV